MIELLVTVVPTTQDSEKDRILYNNTDADATGSAEGVTVQIAQLDQSLYIVIEPDIVPFPESPLPPELLYIVLLGILFP